MVGLLPRFGDIAMDPLRFYKCFADDTRLRCLLLVAHELELCVCELVAALNETQPKISRHLANLRECGLLHDRRQGQWVFYSINPALPFWCRQVLDETLKSNINYIAENVAALQTMGERPERKAACCDAS